MIQLGTALMLLNETEEFIQALKEEDLVRAELEVKKQDLAPAANKLAVVLYPSKSSDHNGALADLLDLVEELQGRGYEVRYTRVHTVVDLASGLLRYTQDRPADLVIIGGHGNPSSILLSPEGGLGYGVLGINDVNELAALNFVLAQQGVILLNSCSTGNGGVSGNNIANAFANAFPQASRILAPYSPAGPRLVFDADNILVDIRYDDSSSGGVVSSVNMKTGKFNPETNLTRSGYDAAGAQGRSVPVAPASAGSQALPVDQGQARSGTVPLASLGDSPSQNNIIVKAFRSLVAGLRSYFANARKAINEKSGLAKVRLAEVFESSTPTLAPPLVRLATWAANVGRRVNALIKGGINGNTERNDGRDKDAGDAVSGSGAKGTQESRSTGFVGRSGDTSTGFGAVVGALSESHSLPSNDLSVVNHSGRAPPVSAIIITAAIIFFLSVLLSKVFGQDNQAIINLIQPAIDPSVAGNQLTANVVKGGAGALLQGLTPLVAAFTTIIGGVTCALLKSKRLRSNISLISLRRTLHLWLQGKTATTILEYSSFITILAPFIPAMAELILGRNLEAGSGIISLAASLPLGIASQSTSSTQAPYNNTKVAAVHLDSPSFEENHRKRLYGKFETLRRWFGEDNAVEIFSNTEISHSSARLISSANGTLTPADIANIGIEKDIVLIGGNSDICHLCALNSLVKNSIAQKKDIRIIVPIDALYGTHSRGEGAYLLQKLYVDLFNSPYFDKEGFREITVSVNNNEALGYPSVVYGNSRANVKIEIDIFSSISQIDKPSQEYQIAWLVDRIRTLYGKLSNLNLSSIDTAAWLEIKEDAERLLDTLREGWWEYPEGSLINVLGHSLTTGGNLSMIDLPNKFFGMFGNYQLYRELGEKQDLETSEKAKLMILESFKLITNILGQKELRTSQVKGRLLLDPDWVKSLTFAGFFGNVPSSSRAYLEGVIAKGDHQAVKGFAPVEINGMRVGFHKLTIPEDANVPLPENLVYSIPVAKGLGIFINDSAERLLREKFDTDRKLSVLLDSLAMHEKVETIDGLSHFEARIAQAKVDGYSEISDIVSTIQDVDKRINPIQAELAS
ncbi:MAG: hypothetical protein WC293_06690, partial [Candidatus Omnitrophota bacterium]